MGPLLIVGLVIAGASLVSKVTNGSFNPLVMFDFNKPTNASNPTSSPAVQLTRLGHPLPNAINGYEADLPGDVFLVDTSKIQTVDNNNRSGFGIPGVFGPAEMTSVDLSALMGNGLSALENSFNIGNSAMLMLTDPKFSGINIPPQPGSFPGTFMVPKTAILSVVSLRKSPP